MSSEGTDAALSIVDALELDDDDLLHAIRADLLRRAGRVREARRHTTRRSNAPRTPREREFLEIRRSFDSSGAGFLPE